ncbi:DUF4931 domain-containing protein [Patescibacteria group bacterium]
MKNKSKKNQHDLDPELRKDIVSGDWILLAHARKARPHDFKKDSHDKPTPKNRCPFEDPQKTNKVVPVLWFQNPAKRKNGEEVCLKDWFLQVIPNKYPAVVPRSGECPEAFTKGPYTSMKAVGFHEVIITRPHDRSLAKMSKEEAELVIRAYQERIHDLSVVQCLKYILVFHNHGKAAGASIYHPHSQLIALPIIPLDVRRSLHGSYKFYQKNKKCSHCTVIKHELKEKKRLIYKNKSFAVIAPYTPRVSFELRIFPLRHQSRFETITTKERMFLADALVTSLGKLYKGLNNPAYNFFVHTAPIEYKKYKHYHWHLEILPKTSIFAGVELGTGVEVVAVSPEETAEYLKKF